MNNFIKTTFQKNNLKHYINQKRLISLFCQLAKIKSPSGQEDQISKIIIDKLKRLGLQIIKDNYGNIIAKIKGKGSPLILSAHLDTATIGKNEEIKIVVKKDIITSDGSTILGADNKDAVSAIMEMLIILSENKLEHCPLEIVFTKEEELISQGAKNLDFSLLAGKECVVADLDAAYGHIIISSPYCFHFNIKVIGKRSHVKDPEKGVNTVVIAAKALSKISLGKIDKLTAVNIGYQVSGLTGIIDKEGKIFKNLYQESCNSIPDLSLLFGEVRGVKLNKVQQLLRQIEHIFKKEADKIGGKIEFLATKLADGYYLKNNTPLIKKIDYIFKTQNIKPEFYHALGGSDANIFNQHNIQSVEISAAHRKSHRFSEYLSIKDLIKLTDFYLRLAIN